MLDIAIVCYFLADLYILDTKLNGVDYSILICHIIEHFSYLMFDWYFGASTISFFFFTKRGVQTTQVALYYCTTPYLVGHSYHFEARLLEALRREAWILEVYRCITCRLTNTNKTTDCVNMSKSTKLTSFSDSMDHNRTPSVQDSFVFPSRKKS